MVASQCSAIIRFCFMTRPWFESNSDPIASRDESDSFFCPVLYSKRLRQPPQVAQTCEGMYSACLRQYSDSTAKLSPLLGIDDCKLFGADYRPPFGIVS